MNKTGILRYALSIISSLILLFAGFMIISTLKKCGEQDKRNWKNTSVRTVSVIESNPKNYTLSLLTSGRVVAASSINLSAEVQGRVIAGELNLNNGSTFKQAQLLFSIDDTESTLTLQAQRNSFKNSVAALLVDLKFDFPQSHQKWENWYSLLITNQNLPQLPPIERAEEQVFVNGKNILNQYYSIKSMEERLEKHKIYAPFSGTLTDVQVTVGGIVNPGQIMARLIPNVGLEIEASVEKSEADKLSIGNAAKLYQNGKEVGYAILIRKSNNIDVRTQSQSIYLKPAKQRTGFKDGEFYQLKFDNIHVFDVDRIKRKALINNQNIFAVKDSLLIELPVELVATDGDYAYIKTNGQDYLLVNDALTKAYAGQKVKTILNQPDEN